MILLRKNVVKCTDFADYEHFALQILTDENRMPSTIAKDYRHQFEEILIDEYQDTNQVQRGNYIYYQTW